MRSVRLALTVALTFSTILAVGPAGPATGAQHRAEPVYVYVSPAGDDGGSGTVDEPFRTLERARNAVRELIADGMTSDVVVRVGGGTYYRTEPLRLDERDSGNNGHQVVYANAPGERPVIVGGRPITGWEPAGGEVYRAPVPDLDGAPWTFNQLFVDDERATLAREPDTGYLSAEWVSKPFLRYKETEAALFQGIAEPGSAQVYVWPQRDWFSNTVAVAGIDPAAREVTFASEILHTLQSQRQNGNRYFVQGFAEALDQPGEWYLDRDEGYVYYRPADAGVSPNEQRIVAPTVKDVFDVRGSRPGQRVHDIDIEGLDFSVSAFTDYFLEHQTATAAPGALRGTVWNRPAKRNRHGIIRLENSRRIGLRDLEIENAGFSGISIDEYSRDVTVQRNEIHEFGYHGVIVTGLRAGVLDATGKQVYDNRDHTIVDNHIHHGGKLVGHGGGVFLNQSGDNLISHNLIHDLPRYGICVKGLISTEMAAQLPDGYDGPDITWENHFDLLTSHRNVISYNDIHTVLQDSEDAGGISFKGIGKGTVVENNHIHDYEVHRGHNKAVYLDDGAGFTLVTKNVVHGLTTAGDGKTYNITAKGNGNRITNNVLVAEDRDGIGINSAQIKNEPILDHEWDHNIFYAPHDRAVLYSFQVGEWFPEWVKAADHNVAYSGIDQYNVSGIPGGATWDNWKTLVDGKYDQSSIAADPLFVDPEADDYRLRPESPALDLGIVSIDISTVGPRAGRAALPASPGEHYAALGYGVFMHYGLATFVGQTPWNYEPEDVPATVYDPPNFDPDQWMSAIAASGAKYIILTTKHHDGFALWPSAHSEYDVANSSDPDTDVVGEVVRAAREHGLEVAFYYSWWDKMEPGGNVLSGAPPTEHYIQFAKNQMRELLTRYGPVIGLWLDIPTGADLQDLAGFIHGVSPETAFVPNLRRVSDAEDVTSFEGPDLEMIPCDYTGKPAEQAYNMAGGPGWWAMTADSAPRGDVGEAVSTLSYINSLGATLSLNVSPGPTGRFSPASVRLLEGIGDRVRGDDLLADAATTASGAASEHPAGHATDLLAKTHWQVPSGADPAWLRVGLAEPLTIDRTAVQFTGSVDGYAVQYQDGDGQWRTAHTGGTPTIPTEVGRFPAVTTSRLRLVVRGASDAAGVVELKAYGGVDDTSRSVTYDGAGWQLVSIPARTRALPAGNGLAGAFNQTVHRSRTAGDTATFTFRGNAVELRTAVGPDQGIARVRVDGGPAQSVDLYRTAADADVAVFERHRLEPGDHTLTIEVTGDRHPSSSASWVTLDRVVPLREVAPFDPGDPYEVLPDGRLAFDDSGNRCRENTPIRYSGPWQSGGWAGAYNGTRHFDYHANSYAELTFEGTGVAVMTQTRPGHGIAAISVDGGPAELVDTYSDPAREQVVVWERSGLAPGQHTVRITVTGDKNPAATNTWIGLDAIIVTP